MILKLAVYQTSLAKVYYCNGASSYQELDNSKFSPSKFCVVDKSCDSLKDII